MKRGLIYSPADMVFELSLSSSYDRTGTLFQSLHGASLYTETCPSYFQKDVGLMIDLATVTEELPTYPNGKSVVTLDIPGIYTYTDTVTGFDGSLSGKIKFVSPKLYAHLNGWKLTWSSIELYANGGLVHTVASGSVESGYLAPAGIPIFGIPPSVGCQAAFSPAPILGPVTPSTTVSFDTITSDSACTGTWTAAGSGLPIYLQPVSKSDVCENVPYPSYSVGNGTVSLTSQAYISRQVTDEGLVECTQCTNGSAIVPAVYRVYKTRLDWERKLGHIVMMPDLPKSIKRGNSDYASLILRGGMPRTKSYRTSMCQDFIADTIVSDVDEVITLPRQDKLLTILRNTGNVVEDTLSYHSYAPHGLTAMKYTGIGYESVLVTPGVCPTPGFEEPPGTFVCATLTPVAVLSTTSSLLVGSEDAYNDGNPGMLTYLHHEEQNARYVNYWVNPHWSYHYYFPSDEAEDPHSWNIEGDAAPPSLYWLPLGDQHLKNPYLPAGGPKNRTSLISAPLLESGLAGFMNPALGQYTSWVGISRFVPQELETTYDVTLSSTSSGAWNSNEATLSFAGTIGVVPTSGSCWVEFDPSLSSPPYMQPHLAHKWACEVHTGPYASGSVVLRGIDGHERILTSFGSGGITMPLTGMPNTTAVSGLDYSGSWGQDWGCLYTADGGVDLFPEGRSIDTYSDEEESYANNLLGGKTIKSMRFYFYGAAIGSGITLEYPRLVSDEEPVLVHEARQFSAVLRKNASGIRWGQWNFWNYISDTFNNPPTWLRPGSQCTVLDWLCFKRLVTGVSATSGLDTEIETLYDQQELGTLDFGFASSRQSCAYYTTAFITRTNKETGTNKLFGIVSNTFSEVPPLAIAPRRARGDHFEANGDFAQEVWSWAIEPRRLICSQGVVDYRGPGGIISAPMGPVLEGWSIRGHNAPTTGDELLENWYIAGQSASGLTNWATATPWHSYFNTMPFVRSDYQPFIHEQENGRWGKVSTTSNGTSGTILYHHSHTRPFGDYAFVSEVGTGWAPIVYKDETTAREFVQYINPASGLMRAHSDDWGETWTNSVLVSGTSVSQHAGAFNKHGDFLLAYQSGIGTTFRLFNAGGSGYVESTLSTTTTTSGFGVCSWEGLGVNAWAVFRRSGRDAETRFSTDNASTWTVLGTSLSETGKSRYRITSDNQGRLVRSWRYGNGTVGFQVWTGSGSGWTAETTCKENGASIVVHPQGYGNLKFGDDGQDALVLTILKEGDSKTSEYICTDFLSSNEFKKVT